MSYYDIYKKRLSKTNSAQLAKSRLEKLELDRRQNFESFLYSSPHYVTFDYIDSAGVEHTIEGVFEPHQQNETKNMMQLLCRVDENTFAAGDVVNIRDEDYMFYYWNEVKNSGYNKWTLVRMNKTISWANENDELAISKAYMYFQEDNMLKNELKSRSRSSTLYLENLKLNFLLMPFHDDMYQTTYLEITTEGRTQAFRVTGIDIVSTPGVMYVSMDPTYLRGDQSKPEQAPEDDPNDFFWMNGGK